MYPRTNFLLRLRPDLHNQVKERADYLGISINEWINRAVEKALIDAPGASLTVTETRKVQL